MNARRPWRAVPRDRSAAARLRSGAVTRRNGQSPASGAGVRGRVITALWSIPLAVCAGALLPLALAPFDLQPLALASAGALFALLRHADRGRRAFLLGWLFGVGKYGVGASWIYVSIEVYGRAPAPFAAAVVAAFVAGLALLNGIGGWAFHRLRDGGAIGLGRSGGRWLDVLRFAWIWVALEWTLTWLLTGFPWLFAGYAFLDTPLAGYAPIGGVHAVSLAAVLTATLLVCVALPQRLAGRMRALAAVTAICAAGWMLGNIDWTVRGEKRSVALVQGNLPQGTKWTPAGWRMALERYEALSAPVWRHAIVVWPEAAIPAPHRRNAAHIAAMRGDSAGDLVLGATLAEEDATTGAVTYYNAAHSTGGGWYRKRHLVPFGEYMPWQPLLKDALALFDLPMPNIAPGASRQPPLRAADLDVAMAICYEVAYPRTVAALAKHSDLLATVSNDTWFGASIGPPQHLQIARMRALENGRFLLRATNNGITAIVDERGSVVARLPQFTAGVLTGEIYATAGATPFARAAVSPTALFLAMGLAAVVALRWLRRRPAGPPVTAI